MFTIKQNESQAFRWERLDCKKYRFTSKVESLAAFSISEITGNATYAFTQQFVKNNPVDITLPNDGVFKMALSFYLNTIKFELPTIVDGSNNPSTTGEFQYNIVKLEGVNNGQLYTVPLAGYNYTNPLTFITDLINYVNQNGGGIHILGYDMDTAEITSSYLAVYIYGLNISRLTVNSVSNQVSLGVAVPEDQFEGEDAIPIERQLVVIEDLFFELCSIEACLSKLFVKAYCKNAGGALNDYGPCGCDCEDADGIKWINHLNWLTSAMMFALSPMMKLRYGNIGFMMPEAQFDLLQNDAKSIIGKILEYVVPCGVCQEPTDNINCKPCGQ
jgi:hypothetical protein